MAGETPRRRAKLRHRRTGHRLPVHAGLADIPAALSEAESAGVDGGKAQWTFLCSLLSARFRGEIGICHQPDMAGCYDIQIAG